ncbi:hypothetical protein DVT68_15160 [Dyella solisilvae]|uniref:Uncharacterized protein n=2 Tax=Dyella solisilvae TaxID=1920168 RepID=A0A370K4Q4_9GAMM|nr:hypothetical protein DVT68_15160 [Dyella solisilvae]
MVIAGDTPTVGFQGFGAARIGMSRQELAAALGDKLVDEVPGDPDNQHCGFVTSAKAGEGIRFMLIEEHLARINVSSPVFQAASGAHIGSTEEEVLAAYTGQVDVAPHAYNAPEGNYLTVHSPDGRDGIRFETDQGRVVKFYAGTAEAIQYIEGCL